MKMSVVAFDSLPDIDLPFRFFVTAVFFVLITAVVILSAGESVWMSRWHPTMLAITHGFTLGFISSVMMGALLQIFPVVIGAGFPHVRLVAILSHMFHVIGTVNLMLGFIWPHSFYHISAAIYLSLGFLIYLSAAGWGLWKKLSQGDTVVGLQLALTLLTATVFLGLMMQLRSLNIDLIAVDKTYTNIHALWGLFGWGGLLVIAVSFQIIPMFHVAPSFPSWFTRVLPILLAIILILMIFFRMEQQVMVRLFELIIAIYCLYTGYLLHIISKRKRKVPDSSINFWKLSSFTLFSLAFLYVLFGYVLPENIVSENFSQKQSLLFFAVFIYGYLMSIIVGMLLKILPFLSYTHLQQRCLINFSAMQFLPNMHDFLNKKQANILFIIHIFTGVSLIITILYPSYYWLFSLLLFSEFSWMLAIMIKVVTLYKNCDKKITAMVSNKE